MSSVALVEDEQSTRRRLAAVIEAAPELTLAGVAADVASGLRLLAEAKPDVLLTDLGLPDGSGIELIRESRRTLPDTLCLVITVFADETHVMDAIASGAAGYVLKDGTEDEICRSIHELTAGAGLRRAGAADSIRLERNELLPDLPDRRPGTGGSLAVAAVEGRLAAVGG